MQFIDGEAFSFLVVTIVDGITKFNDIVFDPKKFSATKFWYVLATTRRDNNESVQSKN